MPTLNARLPCQVRPLQPADLGALMAIQHACYGVDYAESESVYARRLASPAQCSLVVERGGELLAYLAAYWSVAGKVTPLHGDFGSCAAPDVLYLHDMAVHPAHAGQRLADRLLAPLWALARERGIRQSSLVSVQGTQNYWHRHGYRPYALQDQAQLQRLASYGEDAVYMQRVFDADHTSSAHGESGDNAGYA